MKSNKFIENSVHLKLPNYIKNKRVGVNDMKRKYADRQGWARVTAKMYTEKAINTDTFKGNVALMYFEKVNEPLIAKYTPTPITLVDEGMYMLQQFPKHGGYTVTTFLTNNGEVVQWYIDIIDTIGFENGRLYMDDLYLDIIVFPDYTIVQKDIDELEEALTDGTISKELYERAWERFKSIVTLFEKGDFSILQNDDELWCELKKRLK